MTPLETDVLVIGAGSGGLSVAAGAVQMGADVVLLEGHRMGGDCLNYGCVPSKALLAAAGRAAARRGGAAFGIGEARPQIDFAAVNRHVHDVIATIAPVDSEERFEGLGVRVIREYGRFVAPDEVEAGQHRIRARRIVIATGSSPLVPDIPGLDTVDFHTNETIFDLNERPEHLLIIGGGPIGMELAQAHRRLGSRVTVIEADRALNKDDPELAGVVIASLRDEGVEIVENAPAERIERGEGGVTVHTSQGSFEGSHLLVAVGRRINLDRLDLAAGNVAHDRAVTVDAHLRSVSNRRVYAVGDAAGGPQFTHVANYHAGVVIPQILFGLRSRAKTAHLPWVTYTDPELAQVGLTEAEARKTHGERLTVARFEFAENDRAIAERRTTGCIKVMVVRGRPVGATIVGADAGNLIGIWALAIANGLKMRAVSNMVAPYPTLGEINKRAAGAYFSPKLFDNPWIKRVVGLTQKWLP